ncbi:phage minor tail protein domain-containing protein, partial [Escherichia coli]|uniref:phage minor tail protein domain-containing protein n=1 Tax=Escherichia coli TaxID=562 RepID=UPI003EDF73BA
IPSPRCISSSSVRSGIPFSSGKRLKSATAASLLPDTILTINAWLVSRSLWNADQSKDVETLCASVITTWSYDALGAGAEMV